MPSTEPPRPAAEPAAPPSDGATENGGLSSLNLVNAGYLLDLYDRYRDDPASVDDEWRAYFDAGRDGLRAGGPEGAVHDGGGRGRRGRADTEAPRSPTVQRSSRVPAARLAQNMAASLEVPTATTFREIDVATLEARRRELNAADRATQGELHPPHRLGDRAGGVRAALDEPLLHRPIAERPYRVDPGTINLGLAVDVERPDGSRFLVVPVIKGADAMDFAAFHARYEELVDEGAREQARARRLRRRHDHAHQSRARSAPPPASRGSCPTRGRSSRPGPSATSAATVA